MKKAERVVDLYTVPVEGTDSVIIAGVDGVVGDDGTRPTQVVVYRVVHKDEVTKALDEIERRIEAGTDLEP